MKKQKTKMTKDIVPENFTMSLALVDAVPVLFFCASMILVGLLFKSILFSMGAALMLFAGAVKVLWKIIVVREKKNVWWMFEQMRILMPVGMLMLLLSLIMNAKRISGRTILHACTSMPSAICFAVGIIGMILMTVFAFTLDASDVRSNWIEQLTNGIAQIAFFVGLLVLM